MSKSTTIPPRSSKAAILKEKENLPKVETTKPVVTPSDAAPKVKDEAPKAEAPVSEDILKQIAPTGTVKALGCNLYSLVLKRGKRSPLSPDQYQMLGEPLDKIEAAVIKLLPDWLKEQVEKNGPLAGAIMEAATLAFVIWKLNDLPKVETGKPMETPPDAAPKVKDEAPKSTPGQLN